jgi:osmoprotectant transport system ATP-binding protein
MDSTADPMISLREATKRYPDGTVAVHSLNMDVRRGEICVLVGPSGCGKTTTMRMINRLADPTGGQVLVGGEDVTGVDVKLLRRHIGYVIQAVGLFPHYTVRKNVGTVCALLGWDKKRIVARADELLDLVGLDPSTYGDRYPHQLSGGQRQRVAVARALAADPPVLLMDEPFGAVDPIARRTCEQFLALQSQVEKTVVLVTHDIDEAVRMGDRIAVMRQGGYLEQCDPARFWRTPHRSSCRFRRSRPHPKKLSVTPAAADNQAEVDAALPRIPADVSLQAALTALLESPAAAWP